jgi:rfaE bifunctional protein kinase chain/domain
MTSPAASSTNTPMPNRPQSADAIARLKRLVPRLRNTRIGVVGDLMLDRYLWGNAWRLSPEAPVAIVDFGGESHCLGGAGNVAANLADLGAKVEMFSAIGANKPAAKAGDDSAAAIRKELTAKGIGHKGVLADPARVTTVKTRIIARHQHIVRVDRERREPLTAETEGRLLRAISQALPKLDALVLSDYDKGIITDEFADRARTSADREKVPVFIGPKRSLLYAYRGAKAIVCNAKEAGSFVNLSLTGEKSVGEAALALLAHFGCGAVLITRGEKGMTLQEENAAHPLHISATGFEVTYARVGQPGVERGATGRQVFDVTGAGDTVLSVLALASAAGASLPDAAKLANIAAGVVVSKLGTATVTPQELLHALDEACR